MNALRAFEAAARLGGFAAAAAELGVTPAAVAHQVKALEAWLGAPLFRRKAQGLTLTEAALAALPGLSAAFDSLAQAVRGLRRAEPRGQVAIAALPAVAQLWLAPRLAGARTAFPGLSPGVHALEAPPDLRRELFDLAIFFVQEAPPGWRAAYVADDAIFPACAPAVAPGLRSPADLGSVPLLRDTRWSGDWDLWLSAAGVEGVATGGGPAFSLYSMAVQAALDGAGVLMAHAALVGAHIDSGALVAPFAAVVPTGLRLAVLTAEGAGKEAVALGAWLAAGGQVQAGGASASA